MSLRPRADLNDAPPSPQQRAAGIRRVERQTPDSPSPARLPRPQAGSSAPGADIPPSTRPAVASKASTKKLATNSSPDVHLAAKSTGGAAFTEEDTNELLGFYDDIMNLREDKKIDAWITWAHEVRSLPLHYQLL